jgi:hypothetical protein
MKQGHKRSAPLAEGVNLSWRLCVPGDVSRSGFLSNNQVGQFTNRKTIELRFSLPVTVDLLVIPSELFMFFM